MLMIWHFVGEEDVFLGFVYLFDFLFHVDVDS